MKQAHKQQMPQIETIALGLDRASRALLAGKLLMSLDELSDSDIERLWLDEAELRLNEYRAGKTKGIPGDEVFKKAVAELS